MPVRDMIYDGMSYADQIKQLWDSHGGKGQDLTQEEYLSRFRKDDKIYPVITLVWYYGQEPWDGSMDLYGMFPKDTLPEEILHRYVPNYRINLVTADNVEDVNRFHTDLQQIFGMLKCKRDTKKLRKYMDENEEYFHKVDKETYHAIGELLHSESILKQAVKTIDEEETENMKGVLDLIYQEGRTELLLESLKDLGMVPDELVERIMNEDDIKVLKCWTKLAVKAESIEQFMQEMDA
ncbi:MAG: hypothetical protein IJ439_03550 [Tyzzerella sp.]|nr:hypothetical protein [Tyzzerella sp.]